MKIIVTIAIVGCLLGLVSSTIDKFECSANTASPLTDYPKELCFSPMCKDAIANQIKEELRAAFAYLYMASYFDQDVLSQPGITKFMYEAADEERSHAQLMLGYLNERGLKFDKNFKFDISTYDALKNFKSAKEDTVYKTAIQTAIEMEIFVTNEIHGIIEKCKNDFHGADKFTEPILTEQYHGLRKLQEWYKILEDMQKGGSNAPLANFIIDRKILRGDI